MGVAALAVPGFFISLYLLLYKLGMYGSLACTPGGSCATVQASPYAEFLGVPVAGWGVGWYLAVLLVAILGLQPSHARRSWVGTGLGILAAGGLAFTLYLTAVELFVLQAICQWCVASAVLTLLIFGLVATGWFGGRPGAGEGRGAAPGG